jgi:3-hydroxyacyl-CoA dehydrogenase / enoyl-CoA hydratase / 3-hydroxybutyryl-CoA epimerase
VELQHWSLETDADGIAWLCIDKADSSANILSSDVMVELNSVVDDLRTAPPSGLVVHSGKRSGFIMGADIKEFTSVDSPQRAYEVTRLGQQIFDKIESMPFPTVVAINGFAMGGGLELAMAFDYRLALDSDKKILGLPEVKLGLHPGFGGTVRSVQICGVRPAMQLMLTGNPITADKGRRIGLIDRIVSENDWRQAAQRLISEKPARAKPPFVERLLNLPFVRPLVKPMLVKQVASKARKDHYPAPYVMIDLWSRYGASSKSGYEAEAQSFSQLMCTPASRNLVRVFFLQNKLKGQGNKPAKNVSRVHVIGAGVMGGDIAAWCALRGLEVTLQDREQQYIDPAIERAQKLFRKRVRDDDQRAATSARLRSDVSGEGVADADLIIEAIFENLDAKKALYRDVEKTMKPGAILATNTSSIRLEDLRTELQEPERFIGIHFFNPVALMPLVEVIRCDDSAQEALDIGFAFVKGIGKFPLECKSSPGFVVNRILAPYMSEAMHLVQEGVGLADIDEAAVAFGMPIGPVELVDSVGLDVVLHVSGVLGAKMDGPVPEKLTGMVEAGQLGRKSGQGFYKWVDGRAVKPPANPAGVPADIQDRLVLAMVNEAVSCLADGVVSDPDLLDAGVIFGTGFAPFRGGPINYARERGVDQVTSELETLATAHGDRFAPHKGWSAI